MIDKHDTLKSIPNMKNVILELGVGEKKRISNAIGIDILDGESSSLFIFFYYFSQLKGLKFTSSHHIRNVDFLHPIHPVFGLSNENFNGNVV